MVVPERWQDVIDLLLTPIAWVPRLQEALIAFFLNPATPWVTGAKYVFLLLPALLAVAAVWITLLSLYTLPFRGRRVRFAAMMLLAWWDAARAVTLYWVGVVRVAVVAVGWVASLVALVPTHQLRRPRPRLVVVPVRRLRPTVPIYRRQRRADSLRLRRSRPPHPDQRTRRRGDLELDLGQRLHRCVV
jgi:hypothetical protein